MSRRRNSKEPGGENGAQSGIKALQRDLRRLGYLASGIDGVFGPQTEGAVMALQHDLLHNNGKGSDSVAPVSVRDYNKSRVTRVDGAVDEGLAACIVEMLADGRFCKVPSSDSPAAENAKIEPSLKAAADGIVPAPFLRAILKQESGLRHYREPTARDEDNFVVVGLDKAAGSPGVASRGYGIGQVTLFHHPPRESELAGLILNVEKNIAAAARLLRVKFDLFVAGKTMGTRSDDRVAEAGKGSLRRCRYVQKDPRFLADCRQCLAVAGGTDIRSGAPLYPGSAGTFTPTPQHPAEEYKAVPLRKNIPCDWPYAVRRHNGSGMNSYHYQAKILLQVLNG